MKSKKVFALTLSIIMTVGLLSGCGKKVAVETNTTTPAATTKERTYVAVISKGFQHQFWQAVKQ